MSYSHYGEAAAQQVKTWGPPSYVTVADIQDLREKSNVEEREAQYNTIHIFKPQDSITLSI